MPIRCISARGGFIHETALWHCEKMRHGQLDRHGHFNGQDIF